MLDPLLWQSRCSIVLFFLCRRFCPRPRSLSWRIGFTSTGSFLTTPGETSLHELFCTSSSPPPLGQEETATSSRAMVGFYIVWLLYLCIAGTSSDELATRAYSDVESQAHGLQSVVCTCRLHRILLLPLVFGTDTPLTRNPRVRVGAGR